MIFITPATGGDCLSSYPAGQENRTRNLKMSTFSESFRVPELGMTDPAAIYGTSRWVVC